MHSEQLRCIFHKTLWKGEIMKLTDDLVKALQLCVSGMGSLTEVSRRTGVKIETLSRFLARKSQSIGQDTMDQLMPFLAPYLKGDANQAPEPPAVIGEPARRLHDLANLNSDEKILLDVFNALPESVREQKLLELIALAQIEVEKSRAQF